MKQKKLIAKASVVLSAAVLTAASLSSNMFGIKPITAAAGNYSSGLRTIEYTYNKSSANAVTGLKKFTINNSAFQTIEYSSDYSDGRVISTDSDYYLYDRDRNIAFLDSNKYSDILTAAKKFDSNQKSTLDNYCVSKKTKSNKWDDEQVGAMYQFEKIYDYFEKKAYWKPGRLFIADTAEPGEECAYTNLNLIEISKANSTSNTTNSAKEIGVIAHEYTHLMLKSKLGWTDSDLGLRGNQCYYGETAVLDEAYADILGQYAEKAITGSKNWILGDISYNNVSYDRDLTKDKKYTSTVFGENYTHYYKVSEVPNTSNLPAHQGATIIGHVAYQMEKNGIDAEDAEKIWFSSVSKLLQTNNSKKYTFQNCRSAVRYAAEGVLRNKYHDGTECTKLMIKISSAFNNAKIFPSDSYKMGDVTNNGTVDVRDAIFIDRLAKNDAALWDISSSQEIFKGDQYAKGDLDYNGVIDARDFNIIMDALANRTTDKL